VWKHNDCRPETRVNQDLFANVVEGKAKRTGSCIDENQTSGPDRSLRTGNCTANSVRKIAKFGTSPGSDPKHTRRISALDPRCAKRGIVMQMALDTEEACAHFQRKLDPWLIDNIVQDIITREEHRPVGQIQFTRMCIRAAAKERKERRVGPANAELLERWRKEDLQPGSDGSPSWASKIARGRPN
jgi:hypothetical protein